MNNSTIKLVCPKCNLDGAATVQESSRNCIVYVCPRCHSNVVCYGDKVDVISASLLQKLLKRGKLKFCGKAKFIPNNPVRKRAKVISEDDIYNLKIILETESDSSRIISLL